MKKSLVLLALALPFFCRHATADTFTVTNTNDSGAGSFRQAITDANGHSGADTIVFAIPGTNQKTITITGADLPTLTETVTIDGGNNGVATNRVEIVAGDFRIDGIPIQAANCEIRNLVVSGFNRQISLFGGGDGAKIQGCRLCTNPAGDTYTGGSAGIQACCGVNGLLVGGSTAAERNIISGSSAGINLSQSNATIQGNYIGVNAAGTAVVGPLGEGISVSNSSAVIGGTNPGEGNVIVGLTGIGFEGNPALGQSSGTVQGNKIGTNAAGDTALNFGLGPGIHAFEATGVIINGGNLISGNADGIVINSGGNGNSSDSIVIQGNFIGTAADGTTPLGNSGDGILNNSPKNTIGGTGAGEGNVIAFNGKAGVHLEHADATGNAIEGNSIFSNGGLGIDLDLDGPTLNDLGDADTGMNNLQNFPNIAAVNVSGGNVAISGFLNSRPNTVYRLEFFANDAADPSGFGEGQTFLGSTDVTTDGVGNQAFDVSFAFASTVNAVTATATDPDGNTSEFSRAFGTKLQNISTRLNILTGENVLIGGFIITGETSKRVIVRAIGPALGKAGLAGALEDPVLELHLADGSVMNNDNWKETQESEIEDTGLQPSEDLESAIVATLPAGAYTAVVSGKGGGTGIGLVEVYDLDDFIGSILANISTRGFVDQGDNVMIGGFIAGPTDSGTADVVIRAIGPSLSGFGITDPLLDPVLELHDANGALLASNDNWKDTQESEIEATGLAPSDDAESAMFQTLQTGAYTAIVRGAGDTTGVGLVEVYNLTDTL